MEAEIQDAKRDGDVLKSLRLLQRSNKFYADAIMELKATPSQVAEILEREVPDETWVKRLAALYNHAQTQGLGAFQAKMTHIMTTNEAAIVLMLGPTYFDYLRGRVMKVDVSEGAGDRLYDRDNGEGAYWEALSCHGCPKCKVEA